MKKSILLGAALLIAGTASAALENQTTVNGTDYTAEYWNDVHDDGSYWPNWRISFSEGVDGTEVYGSAARLSYTLKRGEEVVNAAEGVNPSWMASDVVTFYTSEGVLAAGDYTMTSTVTFLDAEGAANGKSITFPAVTFTAVDHSGEPKAELLYSVEGGSREAVLTYSINLLNIDESTVAGYRVWLDAPGNVMMGESTEQSGTISVDVTTGSVMYWLKGLVTFTDGSTLVTNPNDVGVNFEKIASDDDLNVDFSCTNPVPLTTTTGTIDYAFTCTGAGVEDIAGYEVYVVTNGDAPVSGVEYFTESSGSIALSNLNESAVTELWAKGTVVMKDGTRLPEITYPGAAQGWYGFSINTVSAGVSAATGLPATGDVWSVEGRLVRRNATDLRGLDAGLYIFNGKLYRVK